MTEPCRLAGHAPLRRADARSEGPSALHLGQDRRRQVPVVAHVTDAAPVGIIGAGIVGLAVARQLAGAGVPVVVFEKESAVAAHQTGHNSGVVHAGIYYTPGSAKARMTRRGVGLLKAYCTEKGLVYKELGKLV